MGIRKSFACYFLCAIGMVRNISIIGACLLCLSVIVSQARGSDTLTVSAYLTSNGSCKINEVQDISFGELTPLNPQDVEASGSIVVHCGGNLKDFTLAVSLVEPYDLVLYKDLDSIPYSLDLPKAVSVNDNKQKDITIPIIASITGDDYQYATEGVYSNSITVEVAP